MIIGRCPEQREVIEGFLDRDFFLFIADVQYTLITSDIIVSLRNPRCIRHGNVKTIQNLSIVTNPTMDPCCVLKNLRCVK